MKVYIAGPMTWLPQFNIPAFDDAAATLRGAQYDVVSPAELDSAEVRAAALASLDGDPASINHIETWGSMLARDVALIADGGIEGIFVLPGWQKSRGARLETFVAKAMCGLPVYTYEPWAFEGWSPKEVGTLDLVRAWAGPLWDDVITLVSGRLIESLRRLGVVS